MKNPAVEGKPAEDQMHATPPGSEDVVGEVARLAADPHASEAEILHRLAAIARELTVDEVFAVMVRYDTPDVLG